MAFFSILYSIIAGLKQDVYSFIGCIVAALILFGGLKWYKSAAPDIEVPDTGGNASGTEGDANLQRTPDEVPTMTPTGELRDVAQSDSTRSGAQSVDQSGAQPVITSVVTETGTLPVADQTVGPQTGGGAPSRRNKSSRKR